MLTTEQLAADITRLASQVEAGGKTASLFKIYKSHFTSIFERLDATIKSVKKRKDLPDQKPHLKALNRIYGDLEDVWNELGQALQAEDNRY